METEGEAPSERAAAEDEKHARSESREATAMPDSALADRTQQSGERGGRPLSQAGSIVVQQPSVSAGRALRKLYSPQPRQKARVAVSDKATLTIIHI